MNAKFIYGFLSTLAVAGLFITTTSCDDCLEGNGKMTTRTVNVSDVTAIRVNLAADVMLVPDSSGVGVTIEGESNLVDLVTLEQNAGRLKIGTKPCIRSHKSMRILVPVSKLTDVQLNGSGNVTSGFRIKTDDLELGINGSGNIELDVDAQSVSNHINGSGNIQLKGSARNQKITVNGSGNLEAADFACSNVKATVNGSGNCRVTATGNLEADIRGSGNIYYTGSPQISADVKGSGQIVKEK